MDSHSPLVLVLAVTLGATVGLLPALLFTWLDQRRERRRDAVRQHLWELEDQIWLDSLPEWEREAIERGRQQRREIRREARRRLGLPEDDAPDQ